jgi:hypothetical protein
MNATPTALSMAKDSAPTSSVIAPAPGSFPAPNPAPTDTRISKPVKAGKQKAKATSEGKRKKPNLPKEKRRARPPKVAGYTWRKDGAGRELRKSIYVVSDTGIRKRRLPYVAHLSKSAFQELKRRHKGAALEMAIAEWIEYHDK